MQNIADLWAKGVANSMNEFDKAVKSENTDNPVKETVAYSKKVKYNNSDFSKALDAREWKKFNNLIATGNDAGLRISPTSLLVECENDSPYIYKYVRYNEFSDGIVIEDVYAIGKIDTNYEDNVQFQAKIIADVINHVKEFGYDNRQYVREILSNYIKNTSYVLAGYSNKIARYNVIGRGSRENGTNTFQKSDRTRSADSSRENGESNKYSVKTNTDEFRTNAMIWANSADTKVGDTKILFGGGKGFALLEATDNGYIEIARGDYEKVRYLYEQAHRGTVDSLYVYTKDFELNRGRSDWDSESYENGRYGLGDNKKIERKELQADSSGNNEYLQSGDKGESDKFSVKTIPNNRVLLSNALETVAQNDIERKYIADYKSAIGMLEKQQEKLAEINQGNKVFSKASNGEYMIPIENKIVFTDGNYDSPQISEIVEVFTEYQTEFEDVKECIYSVEKGKSEKSEATRYVQNTFGEGRIISYTGRNNGVYAWENGKRKGRSRSQVIRNYINEQIRRRNDGKSEETKVATTEATFSNAQNKKYSITSNVVDVNGKEYERVIKLDYSVFNSVTVFDTHRQGAGSSDNETP